MLGDYSTGIRAYAAEERLQVFDFAVLLEAYGHVIPRVRADADGLHSDTADQMVLGKYVVDRILPRFPRASSLPPLIT